MGWLSGWEYRKTVSITGQTGAGTSYQVNFSIGDGSGGDFHLESHCTSFPNDIRVTDNDQTTMLDHWVEDLTVDPITMSVEVADDLGSNTDICIYYRKSGESSASNGNNTFLFFDDFDGASLDTDKWYKDTTGSVTQTNSIVTVVGTATAYINGITGKTTFDTSTRMVELKITDVGAKYSHGGYGDRGVGESISSCISFRDTPTAREYNLTKSGNGVSGAMGWALNHIHGIRRSGTTAYWYQDRSEIKNVTDASHIPVISLSPSLTATSDSHIKADWTLIRKYNSPEPAFSSAGSEVARPPPKSHGYIF